MSYDYDDYDYVHEDDREPRNDDADFFYWESLVHPERYDSDGENYSAADVTISSRQGPTLADLGDSLKEVERDASSEEEVADHLALFMDREHFSDIILQVGGRSFRAHKLVLCSWSEIFHKMFLDPLWAASEGSGGAEVQELVEPEECCQVFPLFLRFLYSETITLTAANVRPVLTLADKYMVQDLRDLCEEYLLEWATNASIREAAQSYGDLEHLGLARCQEQCLAVLEANFSYLDHACLQSMSASLLGRLLHSSNLAVDSESDVFTLVLRWLEVAGHQEERQCHALELLALVRYRHMPAIRLKELLDSHLLDFLEEGCRPQLERLTAPAFQWRALAAEKAFSSMDDDFVEPRLYFNSSFSPIPESSHSSVYHQTPSDDGFYKLEISTESRSYSHDWVHMRVAQQLARDVYKCEWGREMWQVEGVAKQLRQQHLPSPELWGVTYLVVTSHQIGGRFQVAVATRPASEDGEGRPNPSVTLHWGTTKAIFGLDVPPTVLRLTKPPKFVWVKMAIFVENDKK